MSGADIERLDSYSPPIGAWERIERARAWFLAATESEIDALLAIPERERETIHWARIAMVALDQAGVDVRTVLL